MHTPGVIGAGVQRPMISELNLAVTCAAAVRPQTADSLDPVRPSALMGHRHEPNGRGAAIYIRIMFGAESDWPIFAL